MESFVGCVAGDKAVGVGFGVVEEAGLELFEHDLRQESIRDDLRVVVEIDKLEEVVSVEH
jgi:hypothetical protein